MWYITCTEFQTCTFWRSITPLMGQFWGHWEGGGKPDWRSWLPDITVNKKIVCYGGKKCHELLDYKVINKFQNTDHPGTLSARVDVRWLVVDWKPHLPPPFQLWVLNNACDKHTSRFLNFSRISLLMYFCRKISGGPTEYRIPRKQC